MNMKTNPEGWTLPVELPPAFALPQEFRQSLPPQVQEWLNSVEKRIDGMTLEYIKNEADELCEEGEYLGGSFMLYRLGRRLFYTRCQQLIDIMFPQEVIEFGVDLLWGQADNMLPGAAISDAVADGEGLNTNCLSYLKDVGFAVEP